MGVLGLVIILLVIQGVLTYSSKNYLGLILPGITFLFSLGVLINLSSLTDTSKIEIFLMSFFSFVLCNIPTVLFMLIFVYIKINKKREISAH